MKRLTALQMCKQMYSFYHISALQSKSDTKITHIYCEMANDVTSFMYRELLCFLWDSIEASIVYIFQDLAGIVTNNLLKL